MWRGSPVRDGQYTDYLVAEFMPAFHGRRRFGQKKSATTAPKQMLKHVVATVALIYTVSGSNGGPMYTQGVSIKYRRFEKTTTSTVDAKTEKIGRENATQVTKPAGSRSQSERPDS